MDIPLEVGDKSLLGTLQEEDNVLAVVDNALEVLAVEGVFQQDTQQAVVDTGLEGDIDLEGDNALKVVDSVQQVVDPIQGSRDIQ